MMTVFSAFGLNCSSKKWPATSGISNDPGTQARSMTSSATLPESLEIPETTKLPLLSGDYSFPLHIGLPLTIVDPMTVDNLIAQWAS